MQPSYLRKGSVVSEEGYNVSECNSDHRALV